MTDSATESPLPEYGELIGNLVKLSEWPVAHSIVVSDAIRAIQSLQSSLSSALQRAEAAEKTLHTVEAERDNAERNERSLHGDYDSLLAESQSLRAALEKYGRHLIGCHIRPSVVAAQEDHRLPCSCGFTKAISPPLVESQE